MTGPQIGKNAINPLRGQVSVGLRVDLHDGCELAIAGALLVAQGKLPVPGRLPFLDS